MRTIVCYGDSNTWGFVPAAVDGDPEADARFPYAARWPGALSRLLGSGYLVIEEGLNGRTTAFNDVLGKYRNGAKHLGVCLATDKPIDLLIIMLGSNDTKNYMRLTPASIVRGVERLVKTARDEGCGPGGGPPEILIIAPARLREEVMASRMRLEFDQVSIQKSHELAELYFDLARRSGCYYMNASVYAEASPADGLHLDEKNHRKLAKAVCTKVLEIFG